MTDVTHSLDRLHVALDLSPLVEDPLSPSAVRIVRVVDELLAGNAGVRVAGIAPEHELPGLPVAVPLTRTATRLSGWQAVRYTHFDLPRLAKQLGAHVLVLAGSYPPLSSAVPCVALDETVVEHSHEGWGRLRKAAGRAGLQRAARLGDPSQTGLRFGIASAGEGGVQSRREAGVASGTAPRELVLAHGVTSMNVELLLSAWTWVAAASDAQLMVLTCHPIMRGRVVRRAEALGVIDSVVVPRNIDATAVPGLYREANVLLLPGGKSGESPAHWAMSCGLPVVGVDEPGLAAILGDAGYLVPSGDARALGAACLSLLVDEALAATLSERGRKRDRSQSGAPGAVGLAEALHRLVDSPRPARR